MTAQFKRGDTLRLTVTDDVADLSDLTIESAVSHGSNFYKALTVGSIDAAAGTFNLSASTTGWPLGSVDCDIKYTDSAGDIARSYTFQIMIMQEVTR